MSSVIHCCTLKSDSFIWRFSQIREYDTCGDSGPGESRPVASEFSCGKLAALLQMQGSGVSVFLDYKLLWLPVIIMCVNLFSFSRSELWSFGVAAHPAVPQERVWRAPLKVLGFKFKESEQK